MTKVIIAILTLIMAGSVFVIYTRPTYDKVQSIKRDVAEFNKALDKAKELQEKKRELLSKYNTFSKEQRNRLDKLLPNQVDNVRLVLDLDSMASRYGMSLQNVLISGVGNEVDTNTVVGGISTDTSKYDSLTMQFTTSGSYDNFNRFLNDIEGSLRIVDVISLTVAPKPQNATEDGNVEDVEPVYVFNVVIKTYWLK